MANEKKSFKETIKAKFNSAVSWCKENKEVLVVVVPVAGATIAGVTKLGKQLVSTHKVNEYQNKVIYDRSLGHYWDLNRKLSNQEYLAIEQRRKNGERLSDILNDMKVLK